VFLELRDNALEAPGRDVRNSRDRRYVKRHVHRFNVDRQSAKRRVHRSSVVLRYEKRHDHRFNVVLR
jgi:hypothetical protein